MTSALLCRGCLGLYFEGPSVYFPPMGASMILVTGATGSIGRYLVRLLQQQHAPFRAMVRDAAGAEDLECDIVVADYDDPDSVAAALHGVDRLFLNGGGAIPVDGPQPMVRQQIAAIDAAVEAGVQSIVKVSVWGAKPGGKLAEGAHWEIEQHLTSAPIGWSLLQPSGFMQNFRTGAGAFTDNGELIGLAGDWRVSYIDCHDIAACAAALLTGPARANGTYILTGPEALTHAQIAAKLSVGLLELTPAEMTARLTSLGLPGNFAADVVGLWSEVAEGSLAAVTSAVRDLTGQPPRTFDEFLIASS
ncbi:SDR family oxidoreductase [Micromonospora sp. NPDC047738]|uniref:SDR family oxidoreductase n=1 Tax=unclassified Micromonospora TaxID=2617518 RepID=UPI0033DF1FF1